MITMKSGLPIVYQPTKRESNYFVWESDLIKNQIEQWDLLYTVLKDKFS